MEALSCPDRETWERFARGGVDDAILDGMADHLGDCRHCLEVLADLEGAGRDLVDELQGPATPTTLGRFRLHECLGVGGLAPCTGPSTRTRASTWCSSSCCRMRSSSCLASVAGSSTKGAHPARSSALDPGLRGGSGRRDGLPGDGILRGAVPRPLDRIRRRPRPGAARLADRCRGGRGAPPSATSKGHSIGRSPGRTSCSSRGSRRPPMNSPSNIPSSWPTSAWPRGSLAATP